MDTVTQRFQACRFDRRQSVAQHCGEDVDHLTVAISSAGEFSADAFQPRRQYPDLNGAPFLSAPGLRARTGT
jgi:hypothetical protein